MEEGREGIGRVLELAVGHAMYMPLARISPEAPGGCKGDGECILGPGQPWAQLAVPHLARLIHTVRRGRVKALGVF